MARIVGFKPLPGLTLRNAHPKMILEVRDACFKPLPGLTLRNSGCWALPNACATSSFKPLPGLTLRNFLVDLWGALGPLLFQTPSGANSSQREQMAYIANAFSLSFKPLPGLTLRNFRSSTSEPLAVTVVSNPFRG